MGFLHFFCVHVTASTCCQFLALSKRLDDSVPFSTVNTCWRLNAMKHSESDFGQAA